jgi:competence protein ComEC
MIKKADLFFIVCLVFILGITFHSFFLPQTRFIEPIFWYTFFIIFFVLALIVYLFFKNRRLFVVFLGGSFFILGLWRYAFSLPQLGKNHLSWYYGQELFLKGLIGEEPEIRETSIRYTLDKLEIINKDLSKKLTGKILLISRLFPQFQIGDELVFHCQLKKPEVLNNFDYPSYLAGQGIYALCLFPQHLRLVANSQGNRLITILYFLKQKFISVVNQILPEPQASFLGGLLYGEKRSIPNNLKEAFKKTGTAHLVALSGYNISIVAGFITGTLSWFWIPRRLAFLLSVLAIFGFVLLTGASASVVRAAIMGTIVLLGKNIGRLSRIRNVLAFSAAVMLWQNPKILAFDLGFQLSFAATIGLILFSPYFQEKFYFLPTWLNIREAASATFAALIFTFPILLYNFGTFSLIAPLANFLVVPLIPLTMGLGFVSLLLGLVYLPLGKIAGWFVWLPLTYEIFIIKKLAHFPAFEWRISLPLFLGLSGGIIFLGWYLKTKRDEGSKGKDNQQSKNLCSV